MTENISPDTCILAVKASTDWLRSFIDRQEWKAREKHINKFLTKSRQPVKTSTNLKYDKDIFGWYLTLADQYITKSTDYNFFQGSKVIPYFIAIGKNLDEVVSIKNIDKVAKRLVSKKNKHPDSDIFEILTALLYKTNKYTDVEFIPEANIKTPDIKGTSPEGKTIYIECKRMKGLSEYSKNEKAHWNRISRGFGFFIQKHKIPFYMKISFHNEMSSYEDLYLLKNVATLALMAPATKESTIIDNKDITVRCTPIDQNKIQDHLSNNYMRLHSPFFPYIITGEFNSNSQYKIICDYTLKDDDPNFIDEIGFAAAVKWNCAAAESLSQKARHIKMQVANAEKQLPHEGSSVIHVGFDAVEGDEVEKTRMEKCLKQIGSFYSVKQLEGVYCHILSPGCSPFEDWFFEETAYYLRQTSSKYSPIKTLTLIPFSQSKKGFAWDYRASI